MTEARYQEIENLQIQAYQNNLNVMYANTDLLAFITSHCQIPDMEWPTMYDIIHYALSQNVTIPANLVPFGLSLLEYADFAKAQREHYPRSFKTKVTDYNAIR